MASREEVALVSHLMRRAGFGATPDELEEYTAKGYETVVEDMVNPDRCPELEEDIVTRYWGGEVALNSVGEWICPYRQPFPGRHLQWQEAVRV